MSRPRHKCAAQSRCPVLIPAGRQLCPAHQQQRDRDYNRTRPERHEFYGTQAWRRLSQQVRREQPFCKCGQPTTQADHIFNIRLRPDLKLVRGNVIGLCLTCHSRKTAKVDKRWG